MMGALMPALGRAFAIVIVSICFGAAVHGARPDAVALTWGAAPGACAVAEMPMGQNEIVEPGAAVMMCADPGVLIADARDADAFAKGHVSGALHLPCEARGDVAARLPALVARKHTVMVYGDDTGDASTVADGLRQRQLPKDVRIVVLKGGFAAWEAAGLACTSGQCPACAEVDAQHHQGGHP